MGIPVNSSSHPFFKSFANSLKDKVVSDSSNIVKNTPGVETARNAVNKASEVVQSVKNDGIYSTINKGVNDAKSAIIDKSTGFANEALEIKNIAKNGDGPIDIFTSVIKTGVNTVNDAKSAALDPLVSSVLPDSVNNAYKPVTKYPCCRSVYLSAFLMPRSEFITNYRNIMSL
ncbi:hypothetical protein PVAND_012385 [Polypedilum vanderplanki]|uniref:Uncharacterized protein n=1 Tax=Polypedilum vanderplanki TaxID=319348 RepID=A0A9J6CM99_POLVA|nr:hypothetical protein PVAND_012385 [Polypedilum vanderplanki]